MDSSNADLWAALVGFVLPLAISAIIREAWNEAQKASAAFAICMIAAAGTAYFTGNLNLESDIMVRIALIVLTETIVLYKGIYKPIGAADAIDKLTG